MHPQPHNPGAAPQGAYAPPAPQKKGCGKLAIALAVVGGLVVIGLAGLGYYFFGATGSKVKSVAHEHLPEGCDVAVRLDMAELMKVAPVKKHVVSAIEDVMKEEGGGRLAAFLLAARLDPKKDIQSAAVCVTDATDDEPSYGIIVGGKLLDEDGVVKALDKHDTANEFKEPKTIGDMFVLEDKEDGVLVSQSPTDAALILSADKGKLKEIAKKGDDFEGYDIPMDEQMVAVLDPKTVTDFVGGLGGPFGPAIPNVKKVGRVVLTLSLDPGEFGARLSFADKGEAKNAKGEIEGLIAALTLLPIGPTSQPAMRKALKEAKVTAKGKLVTITVPVEEDSIEETCEEIGDKIREENEKD